MAIGQIQLLNAQSFFDVRATLDGVNYLLEVRWNVRAQAFYLLLLDDEGTTVILGAIRMVCNWPLGSANTGRRLPGALVLVDTSGLNEDPGLNDLGKRHQLWYFDAAELGLG